MKEQICDYSSHDLQTLPDEILNATDSAGLNIDFNEIEYIPLTLCSNLQNLTKLSIKGNMLKEMPTNLNLLIKLTELYISENELRILPESIGELKALKVLDVAANELRSLPGSFSSLYSLTELHIHENKIESFPESFGNLKHLYYLNASYNNLESLPSDFGYLEKLEFLNLCSNSLKLLPESFHSLCNVKSIDLSNNKLTFLPNNFSSANVLEKLYIEHNRLVALPTWFEELENVKEISLEENCLQAKPFPENFGIISQKLEFLNLSGNNIKELPASIGDLRNLKFIDIGSPLDEMERNRCLANGNHMTEIPESFSNLCNLTEVHLDENEITSLHENFGQLQNIVYLDLNHNNLSQLPDSFCNLKALKICMLSMNFLECLPKDFGMLSNLEDIRLDNNMLSELPTSFENLNGLLTLDLYGNKLKEIPEALRKLKKLIRLDLRENNFGLDFGEVPEILSQPTYPVRKAEWQDNWRGRKRDDILPSAWVETKEADQIKMPSELDYGLYCALASSSSLWQKHGKISDRSTLLPKENSLSDTEWGSLGDNSNTSPSKLEITKAEYDSDEDWDPYDQFADDEDTLKHPNSPGKSIENANFEDEEPDSVCKNFYENPYANRCKPCADWIPFIPTDIHPPSLIVESWFTVEDGQFDED